MRGRSEFYKFFLALNYALLFLTLHTFAQDSTASLKIVPSIEAGASISYSGVSSYAALCVKHKKSEYTIGPKISLSHLNASSTGPLGIIAGYKYHFLKNKKFEPFADLNYQVEFLKSSPSEGSKNIYNKIHELYFGYGVKLRLSPSLQFGNSIGLGGYYENFYDRILNKPRISKDLYTQLKVFINYDF